MLDYDYFSVLESNRVLSRTLFFHFFSLSTIKFFASSNPPAPFFFFFLRKNQNQNQTKSKKNPKKIQNKACAGGGALLGIFIILDVCHEETKNNYAWLGPGPGRLSLRGNAVLHVRGEGNSSPETGYRGYLLFMSNFISNNFKKYALLIAKCII